MSKIGKKIPCRSCLTEAILVIGKKIVRFKMFDEVGIKQSFENLGNSRSESNRAIVGGVRAVTLLRYSGGGSLVLARYLSACPREATVPLASLVLWCSWSSRWVTCLRSGLCSSSARNHDVAFPLVGGFAFWPS